MFDEIDDLLKTDSFTKSSDIKKIKLHDGERREVSIMFLNIIGFDVISEKLDPEQLRMILDRLLQLLTLYIKHYGGYIDKYEGDLIMALFGAKKASEKDTERALKAALDILDKFKQFNLLLLKNPLLKDLDIGLRIGINTGLVTTGKIGEKREGDFTVYGDSVNLASRMESTAPVGKIMIPEKTMRLVKDIFIFEDYGEIKVKGKSKPVNVYLVSGLKERSINKLSRSEYVGRDKELKLLEEEYKKLKLKIKEKVLNNKPSVIGIKAGAGLGKSRLIYEFLKKRETEQKLFGNVESILQNPYSVFISIIRHYLNISLNDSRDSIKRKLEITFKDLEKYCSYESEVLNLRNSKSMIGYLLGLNYEDKHFKLEPKDLQTHLQGAIRYFVEVIAAKSNQAGAPLIVILEDLHWVDEASDTTIDFLLQTLNLERKREQKDLRQILFILIYRPEYIVKKVIKTDSDFFEIELFPIDKKNADKLIFSMVGNIKIPQKVKNELIERSSGNPFYIEEWINLIKDKINLEEIDKLPIPKTLNALILSRIDKLENKIRLLLQKAAVIGREFFIDILKEIEKKLNRLEGITEQLNYLEENNFIYQENKKKYLSYIFKHITTCEVAYNTLLITNRKILHRLVAEAIEEYFKESIDEFYYDLVYHYEKSEKIEKAIIYLKKAGDQAKKNYDNIKAVEFYNRLLNYYENKDIKIILEKDRKLYIDTLLKKGEIFQLTGRWKDAEKIFNKSLVLSENVENKKLIADSKYYLGIQLTSTGNYYEALNFLNESLLLYKELINKKRISNIHRNIGNIYYFKSDYNRAMKYYERSRKLSKEIGDIKGIAGAISNMGMIYDAKSDYDRALECYNQDLIICNELGDKTGISTVVGNIGVVYFNKGNFTKALECWERQLELSEELGDKAHITTTNGNIGNIYKEIGNFPKAKKYYKKSLILAEEIGDKTNIAVVTGNIGNIYEYFGEYSKAMENYNKSISICEKYELRYFLNERLFYKANLLFKLKKYRNAKKEVIETLKISEKIEDKEFIFLSSVLKEKLSFEITHDSDEKNKVINNLKKMLLKFKEDEHIAILNYELWNILSENSGLNLKFSEKLSEFKDTALSVYRRLVKKNPKFEYKKRIEELEKK